MTDRPIIFSAPAMRALLAGRKTQTRRVLKPQPGDLDKPFMMDDGSWHVTAPDGTNMSALNVRFAEDDRLWIREAHRFRGADYGGSDDIEWFRCYSADGARDSWDPDFPTGWQPTPSMAAVNLTAPEDQEGDAVGYATKLLSPILMPRWASRLTLTVTDVRVQRLQEISEEDARAEGVTPTAGGWWSGTEGQAAPTAKEAFALLWNSTHGADAWQANPWVIAASFTAHRGNIDSLAPDARMGADPGRTGMVDDTTDIEQEPQP